MLLSPVLVLLFLPFLCRSAVLAAKQCRLKPRSNGLAQQIPIAAPTSPANHSTSATAVQHGTASRTSTSSAQTSAIPTLAPFAYGTDKVIGVNLGGWFVLEPWITPSIFEGTNNSAIVDEYTFGQFQDPNVALNTLKNHWATWITENDFKTMAAAGLNHVRIPFGYWSIPTGEPVSPFIPGAWPYLMQALQWARNRGIHVIVDLHGAPGSQNGYDNSGQRTGNPVWALNPDNITRTINDLVFLANATQGMIDILELLNEPIAFQSDAWASAVRGFWQNAYTAVRNAVGGGLTMMIGDGFLGVDSWQNFLTYPSAEGVLMDVHQYQIFSDLELNRTQDEHIQFACSLIPQWANFSSANLWTIMGEWSAASTDCALWLNGRGVGSRWDGTLQGDPTTQVHGLCDGLTGSSATFSSDYKTFLRKYWEVQSVIGDSVQGNIWWTWKAENADEWDYSKGLQGGWIPQDPTERLYPNICN